MKTWFFSCLLSSLCFAGSLALAQTAPAPSPLSAENSPSTTELPRPLTAAPPPEPELPSWGDYLAPSVPSIAPRFTEYTVIGPPVGIIQQPQGQDYRIAISDPGTLLDNDRQIGQVVNIFRPDGMAPIGVFGDHNLPAGTMHVSYRYLQNSYDQNYTGSQRISVGSVAAHYPYAPANGMSNSQVALIEYGVTTDLTLLAYLPFQHNEINYQTSSTEYKATFTNPGDIRLMGLYVLNRGDRSQSHLNLGLSVPVGMLESQTVMPSPTAPNLPYQLRTSSGTYDMILGYTYRGQTDNWTWGAQGTGIVRTGKNTLGYELGNEVDFTSWLSRRLTDRWSTSARIDAHLMNQISGADTRLDPTLSPVNQTNSQGGRSINALLGMNFYLSRPESRVFEQRLFLEAGVPMYQTVNGPQLGISWILNAGWGTSF